MLAGCAKEVEIGPKAKQDRIPTGRTGTFMETQDARLLVVDDNESNRDIMARQLRRKGYDVITAEDGERALQIVDDETVDLIILDIMMPGIDGVEVLRRLRRKHSPAQLPIIMATAKTDPQDIVQTAELGANDHVGKPLDFAVIGAKVQALLRLKAAAAPSVKDEREPTLGELEPGVVLAEKYRLGEKIGSGTFGAVFKAIHQGLDHEIAIKILQPSLTATETSLKRFQREGVAACRVQHPNAVTVFDSGVTQGGVAFLAMELLQGRDLTDELRAAGGRLSPSRTYQILQPVCDVLAEAHSQGLIHRDIKPENVFLHRTARDEVVKVLDFGIAKLVGEATVQENLTAEGWILGTPAYIAPERLANSDYDGRSDVYSLGVMTYEMLSGRRPFRTLNNDPMSLISQQISKQPPSLRSIDPDLTPEIEAPVMQALAKDPGRRPTPRAFARAIERAVEESTRTVPLQVDTTPPLPDDSPTRELPGALGPTVAVESQRDGEESGLLRRWLKKLGG